MSISSGGPAGDAQRELLARVSREMRTPLVAVIGMAGLLLESELAARQRYAAEAIRHSGETLLGILNRLHEELGISAEPGPAPATPSADAAAAPRRRVLVAEDDAINRKVVSHMLERRGWVVDVVGNGREAVEAVARLRYDLVVMDCDMPEVDGYAASAAIRAREGSGRRIPIVAMTAGTMPGDRDRCLASGMDDYVAKPFNADALDGVLRRWTEATTP
jgi:two-component system sensor histidine kinase/response regulator